MYISHPINAYGVIKRMLDEEMINFGNPEFIRNHENLKNLTKVDLPTIDDFYTASSSLALLQESYSLKTEDMSEGNIKVIFCQNILVPQTK